MDRLTHLYSGLIVVDGVSKVVNLVIIKQSLLLLVLHLVTLFDLSLSKVFFYTL